MIEDTIPINDEHVPLISPQQEMTDRRRNLTLRFIHRGYSSFDILSRLMATPNIFPSSFDYFQMKTVVEREMKELQERERESILKEEEVSENHRVDYLARTSYLYHEALKTGDLVTARVLSRDLAEARGVGVSKKQDTVVEGIADILRQVSKMGRKVAEDERAENAAAIDVTPIPASSLDHSVAVSESIQNSERKITASPAAQKSLSLLNRPLQKDDDSKPSTAPETGS